MTELNPLLEAARGRDEDDRWFLFAAFSALPEKQRDTLVSPETMDQIKAWSTSGLFPTTHIAAISKLIGLIALDTDVQSAEVPTILQKLGLTPDQAQQVSANILNLLQPILAERAADEAAEAMQPLPPLTTTIPARNIIDLRKQQPPNA